MKAKRRAAASLSPGLRDAVEVPVLDGHVAEEKGRDEVHVNGENPEEEEEWEGEAEEEEEEGDEEGEGEEEEERPKLDEGFFEIEAIRRKRVRKGQLQYLIKWRGWPETANTWEPLENLQSCADVIDAFEESLRSGKSSRKRKRKSGGPHSLAKKKPHSSAVDGMVDVEVSIVDKPYAPLNNSNLVNLPAPAQYVGLGNERENDGIVSNLKTAKKVEDNGSMNSKHSNIEEDNEYDPKLSELRGSLLNDASVEKLPLHIQEGRPVEGNGPANGLPKTGYVGPDEHTRRTGAKRRKSGSVKRFRNDSVVCQSSFLESSSLNIAVGTGATTGQLGIGSIGKPLGEDHKNASTITKILKPISFSASVLDNVQDVLVTFVAERSDGEEVVVDNKFLKVNYPHLLISFYEQHLKYSM
ncbi:hypothetical protein K2173_025550 [Erythroxylum novogranatense]|uniref:Chromo domain-containing protein n=1 Tax=Erythroxylum novogranatense TaxID=1862640 RepID=A0AAV8T8T2_9ROSI|nr:hypothetical protein K2173_025550 [Erythroxylum novogranatense]